MIHIVFNEADIAKMNEAIALDETLNGEVIQIKDDYAVGPLENGYTGEGRETRVNWWRTVLDGGDYAGLADSGAIDDFKTVAELVGKLRRNENEHIWIWAAQNKHDVSGYYWLLHFLKEFQGRVYILYLNNLPFINEKGGIFYPQWLGEIPATEFRKARKLARPVTTSEFELDADEWQRLSQANMPVRLLEGGKKLVQKEVDFYDQELKKFITGGWQKASKVINNYNSKSPHKTGDAFLLWRLKEMVNQGKLESKGLLEKMRDFEVTLPGAKSSDDVEVQDLEVQL